MIVDLAALAVLGSMRELRVPGMVGWCSPAMLTAEGLGALTQLTALTWGYINPAPAPRSGKPGAVRETTIAEGGEHA